MDAHSTESIHARIAALREAGVHSVFTQFTDMQGAARGKLVPLAHWQSLITTGAGFAGPSIWGTGLPRSGKRSEYYGRIVPHSMRALPWWPGVAHAVCDGFAGGEPLETCSRQLLQRVLAQAKAMGYTAWVGVEPEFFLLDPAARDGVARIADAHDSERKPSYDFVAIGRQQAWLSDMQSALQALDFDVLQIDHEDANGQWEINYRYDEMLAAADRYMLFKMSAQAISERHGYVFSAMPKPFADGPGSGLHFHLSLTDAAGQAVFSDGHDSHGLSAQGHAFAAGLLTHAPALAACCAPTVNSYKRLAARVSKSGTTWSPNIIAWGDNNRTALVRSVDGRLEWRLPDPSCNIYLALAASLAAGLLGLQHAYAAWPAQDDDLYALSRAEQVARGLTHLPSDLGQALCALQNDQALREMLGAQYSAQFLQLKDEEWAEWQSAVTDWELRRYAAMA